MDRRNNKSTFRTCFAVLVFLAILPGVLTGCRHSGNDAPASPPAPTYEISGTITGPWTEGITISLAGASTASATTDENGNYRVASLPTGTYTVTPSLPGYRFEPADKTVVITDTSQAQNDFVSQSMIPANSISGMVTYQGGYSGPNARIYISLWKDGLPTGRGTSIASTGTYTIRGVPEGTYVLNAEMDILGTGTRNAVDPHGTLSPVVITTGDLAGQDIALSDAVVAPPATPTGLRVNPGSQSAIIAWNGNYANQTETATAYTIYWGPTASAMTNSVVVPAYGRQMIYFQSISDGVYSYRISSMVGTAESAASAVVGPVTIGAGAGANTITGTVTIPHTPTGPLYVGVYDGNNIFYFTRIASPSRSEPYTISGVPSGTYQAFAVVDMNNNGFLDAGDLSLGIKSGYQLLTVGGPGAAASIGGTRLSPLPTASSSDIVWNPVILTLNAISYANTNHWQSGSTDYYSIKFEVDSNIKRPVSVILVSGPNVPVPMDITRPSLSNPMAFAAWVKSGTTGTLRPSAGDLYTYKVTYSDGTSELLSASVTAVLDSNSFAQNLEVLSTPTRTVPTFSWQAPVLPPPSYTYGLRVWPLYGDNWNWLYPQNVSGMPASQPTTTVQFNIDAQQGIPSSLTQWVPYGWTVYVMDANGNLAQSLSSFFP